MRDPVIKAEKWTPDQVLLSVYLLQFRETIRKFCDAELAPYADQIDRDNQWDQFRPFWKKLGDMGLHGITAPGEFDNKMMWQDLRKVVTSHKSTCCSSAG